MTEILNEKTATYFILFDLYQGEMAESFSRIKKSEKKRWEEPRENAGRLLSEYGDSILRLSYSYLHRIEDAEDVVQDTLLQYMKTVPIFQDANHEKAWLLRVAINICKNRLKQNRCLLSDELDEQVTGRVEEDLCFVWEAVKSLPVRSLLLRARNLLRDTLKEEYDFEV